jgi:hypothetical protein
MEMRLTLDCETPAAALDVMRAIRAVPDAKITHADGTIPAEVLLMFLDSPAPKTPGGRPARRSAKPAPDAEAGEVIGPCEVCAKPIIKGKAGKPSAFPLCRVCLPRWLSAKGTPNWKMKGINKWIEKQKAKLARKAKPNASA